MCGIFGYVGKSNRAQDIVFEGLKTLEYRGYDSWGVAAKVKKHFFIEKHIGKIGNSKLNSKLSGLNSKLSIGHTRWATHGGVTVENAHPHLDCTKTIAVMHNGIIENYEFFKKDLIGKGHMFVSETDTEVVPHLIEEYLKKGFGFSTSVRNTFNLLTGLNAIIVAFAPSSEIVAVKNGSPLVLGADREGLFISSDVSGLISHTRKIIFLEDNQMIILGKKIKLFELPQGKEIRPVFHKIDWKFEKEDRGKFKYFLLKEIYDQPKIIENIALNYSQEAKKLARLVETAFGTFMLGCGTASYAALAGVYFFSRVANKHVNFSIGSEFNYLENYLTPQSLVIPISQSGETIDVIEPVKRAREKGSKIAAVVNVLGSTLYRQADTKIMLGAGMEKAVVGTKSFTAMVSVLLLTAFALAKREKEGERLLRKTAKNVREILRDDFVLKIKKIAEKLKDKEHIFLIGRGVSYATALEASLKLKETSYVHAEGFAGGELKHGVIALIEKDTPCIVFAPNDETYDDILSNAQEIKARGGFMIGIGPKENNVFDVFLKTEDLSIATIIPQVVISQLLAFYLAIKKGVKDPDKPRNLAKSVTVK